MPRKFGPKPADDPSIGQECLACHKPFKAGDYTTLIPLGPGGNKEQQEKCRAGRYYTAIAVQIHWDCSGAKEDEAQP